jgi:hypothetical protein
LLALGFTPTRYQFSQATVEVGVDIHITEQQERESESEGNLFGLRAGTYEVTQQRKFDREVRANANISARLEPVPLPVDLSPAEVRGGTEEE